MNRRAPVDVGNPFSDPIWPSEWEETEPEFGTCEVCGEPLDQGHDRICTACREDDGWRHCDDCGELFRAPTDDDGNLLPVALCWECDRERKETAADDAGDAMRDREEVA